MALQDAPPSTICRVSVQDEPGWARVSVAVDPGAVAHVAPANVVALEIAPQGKSWHSGNDIGTDGRPVPNLCSHKMSAEDADGQSTILQLDIANFT